MSGSGFRKAAILSLSMLVLAGLAGCGIEADSAPQSAGVSGAEAKVPEDQTDSGLPEAKRVPRSQGSVRIAGEAPGSITELLTDAYAQQGDGSQIQTVGGDEASAFAAFCRGEVDIVDSSRPISRQEYRDCAARGILPVQFQIASDAAVLAIKNETDVGNDCLALGGVREIFRPGSPVSNWSQVGYDSAVRPGALSLADSPPMTVVGPTAQSKLFDLFVQFLFDDPDPTLASVRSDYEPFANDAGARRAVTGSFADLNQALLLAESEKVLNQIVASIADAEQAIRDARAEVKKGIKDERPKEDRDAAQKVLDDAKANLAKLKRDLRESRRFVKVNRAAQKRVDSVRGTLGLFRFSYYEAFEDQLRPMEISSSGDPDKPECIFPSEATVTSAQYPLARQLLYTVNYRNLLDTDINDFLSTSFRNSQRLAKRAVLVPLPNETLVTQRAWLDGTSEPNVVFYDDRAGSGGNGGSGSGGFEGSGDSGTGGSGSGGGNNSNPGVQGE